MPQPADPARPQDNSETDDLRGGRIAGLRNRAIGRNPAFENATLTVQGRAGPYVDAGVGAGAAARADFPASRISCFFILL
jgi:hypothetical protein